MANRVMIVEDEPAISRYAELALKRDGYEVITAPNAEAALLMYSKGMFDCLVVDYMLGPGKTGVDFIKEIREHDQQIGIVMATGTLDITELAVEGLSVWSCVHKPYDQKLLSFKVSQACELSHMAEEKIASLSERMAKQTDRLRATRSDLRSETTILPPGVLR